VVGPHARIVLFHRVIMSIRCIRVLPSARRGLQGA
jgi:hypothetical protein